MVLHRDRGLCGRGGYAILAKRVESLEPGCMGVRFLPMARYVTLSKCYGLDFSLSACATKAQILKGLVTRVL